MKPNNPFLITGYQSPEYFCDRTQETETMKSALHNGRNLTLIAPRRMGKTGLIKNVFYKLKEEQPDIVTLYMDIYSTQNLSDFVHLFAGTVFGRLIDITPSNEENTLKEIFDYLQSSEKHCYIAVDEFQQVTEYPEKGVEALLRSYIQFLPNVNFIFAGSKQHLMQEMFLSAKRPFYQSTQTLFIDKIDEDEYYRFASGFFQAQGHELSEESFSYLYREFDGHTWYVQALLNRLYGYKQEPTIQLLNYAIEEIISESTYAYENILAAYSSSSIKLIKGIAKERCVREINSGEFITKHKLKAASSVNTALKKLINNELVYKTSDGYIVYDRFMSIWLRQQLY